MTTLTEQAMLQERLDARIGSLVNRGADICPEYDLPPDLSLHGCKRCGYTADVHLLRDARWLVRDLRVALQQANP